MMRRTTLCALLLAVASCGGEGNICFGDSESCDGDTMVACVRNPNNPSTIRRTPCRVACLERGDSAACVEATQACDPATYQPSCVDDLFGKQVITCQPVFSSAPQSYPTSSEPGCGVDSGYIYTCNPDNTATVRRCENDNSCQTLGGTERLECAFYFEPCDPSTFQQACSVNANVVICADLGSGEY
jgi:hypothetical protein